MELFFRNGGIGLCVSFQGDSVTDAKTGSFRPASAAAVIALCSADAFIRNIQGSTGEFLKPGDQWKPDDRFMSTLADGLSRLSTGCFINLVGVNDTLRRFDSNDPTAPAVLEQNYRFLLEKVKANTNAKIIMMEPFVLMTAASREEWHADLDPKIAVIRKLAPGICGCLYPIGRPVCRAERCTGAKVVGCRRGCIQRREGAFFIAQEYVKAIKGGFVPIACIDSWLYRLKQAWASTWGLPALVLQRKPYCCI